MSKARGVGPAPTREINEALIDFLAGVARFLFWAGALATIIGVGFLIYMCTIFSGSGAAATSVDQALSNIAIFEKFVLGGVLALGVSSTYLFWGEQILAAIQIVGGGLLFFSPFLLTTAGLANASSSTPKPVNESLAAISQGGLILGVIGLVVLAVDLIVQFRERSRQGWKLDQMRYGKGIKEEVDRHNVFLGKCWQLPFCRKFVRERCPIYHSRRTCWRELTGCMCEEEVIRNAMENKAIPKDALMAATYIPRNMKLSIEQKRERCRSCVIYNEHQKHKYKAALPATLAVFVLIYVLLHGPLIAAVGGLLNMLDKLVGKATLQHVNNALQAPTLFQELLLACFMIVLFAYAMKLLEYLFFKIKI